MAKPIQLRPRDPNQLAKLIVDISVGEITEDTISSKKKKPPMRGRAGGIAGSKARAIKLTPEERSKIARIAATARWKKTD